MSTTSQSFATSGGKVTTNFGGNTTEGYGATLQADGKVLVVGYSYTGVIYGTDFAIVRYNADGSFDNTFDSDGRATTDLGGSETAFAVTTQTNGKVVVAGTSTQNFALARYNADGSLDSTFGASGKVVSPDYGIYSSIAVQGDGKILTAGTTIGSGIFTLARYTSDGSLDNSFASSGKVQTSVGTRNSCNSLTVQADGKILVAGGSMVGRTYDFALVRYNSDGSLDTTFDSDGKVITDFGGQDTAYSVALQSDGKILLAGESIDNNGISEFTLARYNPDGTLDTNFGTNGKVTADLGGFSASASSATVQADGKILVAGTSVDTNTSRNFALVRLNNDGSLDKAFDSDGKVTTHMDGFYPAAKAVMVNLGGEILVAGTSEVASSIALVRYNTDGSLDASSSSKYVGTSGDDKLYPGSSLIDGGAGLDVVIFPYARATYTQLAKDGMSYALGVGSNTLSYNIANVERLQFADKKIALDLSPTGNAGKAIEFVGAIAHDKISDASVVGTVLSYIDQGFSLHDLFQLVLDAGVIRQLAGSDSNTDLAKLVYRNVTGLEASTDMSNGLAAYLQGSGGSYSKVDFLTTIAGLDANQTHINLVGLAQTGVEYV